MSNAETLNGYMLYNSFMAGYENLQKHKNHINDINVFPVPDGDTGNNMVSTFYSTIQSPVVSRSLHATMNSIADRALTGARGNSGIIVAQYLNSLANECSGKDTMSTLEFGSALLQAARSTYDAIENPQEGTLITLLRVWSEEMHLLGQAVRSFRDVLVKSIGAARNALEKTREQLAVLRKANVVDAGASGFVLFLEGVASMIVSGKVPPRRMSYPLNSEDEEEAIHDLPDSGEDIPFRYCTEALLLCSPLSGCADKDEMRETLKPLGDSLIISRGREKTKIHIHTNEPANLFFRLKEYGRIIEQKVDDMHLQYQSVHHPVSQIAILTDSIADIPQSVIDRYRIHVIPQKILWGEDEYLDRLTITPETFYPWLDKRPDYPTSSIPDPRRVDQVFSWLASHYAAIIAIPVAKALSGTWQVMETCAAKMRDKGYPIRVVDSKLNSAAEGLVVMSAAEDAAAGLSFDDILLRLEQNIRKARIYVSVQTFRYMVRGGRISALKGFIGALTNLKPIVSLDPDGKGVAFGASFSQSGSRRKILKKAAAEASTITRYAVVHAASADSAAAWAEELTRLLGYGPEYIMEISPIVGIHAGVGAVALAWL